MNNEVNLRQQVLQANHGISASAVTVKVEASATVISDVKRRSNSKKYFPFPCLCLMSAASPQLKTLIKSNFDKAHGLDKQIGVLQSLINFKDQCLFIDSN